MTPRSEEHCEWRLDDYDFGTWTSGCGLLWVFSNDDTPKDNGMNYCLKCGKELKEMKNSE